MQVCIRAAAPSGWRCCHQESIPHDSCVIPHDLCVSQLIILVQGSIHAANTCWPAMPPPIISPSGFVCLLSHCPRAGLRLCCNTYWLAMSPPRIFPSDIYVCSLTLHTSLTLPACRAASVLQHLLAGNATTKYFPLRIYVSSLTLPACRAASVLQHLLAGNAATKERLLHVPIEQPPFPGSPAELLMPR